MFIVDELKKFNSSYNRFTTTQKNKADELFFQFLKSLDPATAKDIWRTKNFHIKKGLNLPKSKKYINTLYGQKKEGKADNNEDQQDDDDISYYNLLNINPSLLNKALSFLGFDKIIANDLINRKKEIKKAYYKLSLLYHPDRAEKNGFSEEESNKKTKQLNKAYEIIKTKISQLEGKK